MDYMLFATIIATGVGYFGPILEALNSGVDMLFASVMTLVGLYITYLVYRARDFVFLQAPMLAPLLGQVLTDSLLQAPAKAAARFAEEWKETIKKNNPRVVVSAEQTTRKALEKFFDNRIIRMVVSEERAIKLIQSVLPQIGLGAAGAITVGVDVVDRAIKRAPEPDSGKE